MKDTIKFVPVKKIRLPLTVYRQERTVFVTISTHHRQKWFLDFPSLAQEASDILLKTARERSSSIFAWCIMPDHVHLLVGDDDIVSFVRTFKGRLVPKARGLSPKRKLWQRSFYDHILRKAESAMDVAGYIFENPVRSGLVVLPQEYLFVGSEVWPDWRALYT
jgi:REP element-mobilizing transposase RayT